MSKPEEPSPEGSWTEAVHHAISSTSEAIHRVVHAVARHPNDTGASDTTSTPGPSTKEKNLTPPPEAASGSTNRTSTHPIDVASIPNVTSKDVTTGSSAPTSTTKDTNLSASPSTSSAPEPGQTASPTLTDKPSHISTAQNDPSHSDPKASGHDNTQPQSKDKSADPTPQTKHEGRPIIHGAELEEDDAKTPDQAQANKKDSVRRASEASPRLKGSGDSCPTSMANQQTSHPEAKTRAASDTDVSAGGPPFEQVPKEDKQSGKDPLNKPPKPKEDSEDSGTGQKYVRSTGVAAEGGDFDASKPGAGVKPNS